LSQKSRRFASLLGYEFRRFSPAVALQILETSRKSSSEDQTSLRLLKTYFTSYDLERMELYGKGVVDYHLIVDILPQIVKMIFTGELNIKGLSVQQKAILVALGLQYKSVSALGTSVGKPATFLAGAGAKFENFCGRGRSRGLNLKNLAGAGGRGRPPARPQCPQRPQCGVFPTLLGTINDLLLCRLSVTTIL
jgi:hypothetical protein